jgi:hypothetical protein
MFGSSLPSALGWLATTKVYSGTGADIVMESIALVEHAIVVAVSERLGADLYSTVTDLARFRG